MRVRFREKQYPVVEMERQWASITVWSINKSESEKWENFAQVHYFEVKLPFCLLQSIMCKNRYMFKRSFRDSSGTYIRSRSGGATAKRGQEVSSIDHAITEKQKGCPKREVTTQMRWVGKVGTWKLAFTVTVSSFSSPVALLTGWTPTVFVNASNLKLTYLSQNDKLKYSPVSITFLFNCLRVYIITVSEVFRVNHFILRLIRSNIFIFPLNSDHYSLL